MTVTQMPQTQHHSTTNVCVVLESETFSRVLYVREICKAFLERSYERIHHEFKQLNQSQGGKSSKEGLLATIMYPDAQNGNQGGQCKNLDPGPSTGQKEIMQNSPIRLQGAQEMTI